MSEPSRYCPICQSATDDEVCLRHGVPTIPRRLLVPAAAEQLLPGCVLGNAYRIERVLGTGGMGCVYAATQLKLQREVALKTLHPRLLSAPRLLGRFYQEARACTRLHEPHVVRVYDFGVDESTGTPYLAMEMIRGRTLRKELSANGPMRPKRAAGILAQVARALLEAQQQRIVHRDLKSENVMLVDTVAGDDFIKVMDFGIAKLMDPENGEPDLSHGEGLTVTGAGPMGTPRTMAPEQILGNPVDFRTDLYALGCMLYEMLTGHGPYDGADRLDVMSGHLSGELPTLPSGSDELTTLGALLLRKRPEERPSSVRGVMDVLLAVAAGERCNTALLLAGETSPVGEARVARQTGSHKAVPDASTIPTSTKESLIRPRRWPWVVGSLAALVVVAVLTWAVWPRAEESPVDKPVAENADPTPEQEVAEPPAPPAPKPSVDTPTPTPRRTETSEARRPRTAADEPAAPQVAIREYVVDATTKARVIIDGKPAGTTPFTVKLADDAAPVSLVLKPLSNKHRSKTISIAPGGAPTQKIKLPKRRAAPSPGGGEGLWPRHGGR